VPAQSTSNAETVIHRSTTEMTPAAYTLFLVMGLLWGLPYLFIKIAIVEVNPFALAGLRTLIASVLLIPLAMRAGALRPVLKRWPWAVVFGVMEIAIPWVLVGHAESRITSGFAGLMIATVPIAGAVVAYIVGDHHALSRVRLIGLGIGVLGVVALVGLDSLGGHVDALSVIELLLVAVCYAAAPMIVSQKMGDLPSIGVIAVAILSVTVIYLPATIGQVQHGMPSPKVSAAILVLGLVCTALAFIFFFKLLELVGPARSTVITFLNPAVAVALGILVLGEPLTAGTAIGFPLVLLGSYFATKSPKTSTPAEDGRD
jgi:drug/metabolite transporter (DMT)-like permease